jgi:hypothetical protein
MTRMILTSTPFENDEGDPTLLYATLTSSMGKWMDYAARSVIIIGNKPSGLRRTRAGLGGAVATGGLVSMLSKGCCLLLSALHGIMFMPVSAQVHKLDPAAPPKTSDTNNMSGCVGSF